MSLDVYPFTYGPDGTLCMPELPPEMSTSVGAEATRIRLWSAPAVRSLGATYLPRLADGDLFVPPEETGAFLRECATLLAHLPVITAATRYQATYEADEWNIEDCLVTMIRVVHWARAQDYGVLIW
ncbi:hypothetical protein [Dactylosporangium darangshiense]|uniref:Uncharacterized protein n=1 Tax=Dactylosporangium darangshiense TaxID=579108 RepID=A0ABP8DWK3_9ACTN